MRMAKLKLDKQPAGEESEHAQEDDDDDAGDDTDDGEGRGQGEHAIGHDFRDHQHSDELP